MTHINVLLKAGVPSDAMTKGTYGTGVPSSVVNLSAALWVNALNCVDTINAVL